MDSTQLNTRHEWFQQKEQLVDGVEVLLLSRDFKDLKTTEKILLEAKRKFGRIALEMPDCVDGKGIDPVSHEALIRACSKDNLDEFVKLSEAVGADYAQYQLMRENFGEDGMPASAGEGLRLLIELRKYHHDELVRKTEIPLQMENTIPLNPSGHADKISELHYEPNTTRVMDFQFSGIPLAYDTAHAMSAAYTYFRALSTDLFKKHGKNGNGIVFRPVETEIGTCYTETTRADIITTDLIKNELAQGRRMQDALTYVIIHELANSDLIRSVQLQNAINFGISHGDHGRVEGWLDLEKICKAIPKGVPIIPEVTEDSRENYEHNPVNQRKLLKRMHRWLETA